MSKSRLKNPKTERKDTVPNPEPVEVLEAEVLPVEPAEPGEEGDDLPEVIDLSEDATIEPGDVEPGEAERAWSASNPKGWNHCRPIQPANSWQPRPQEPGASVTPPRRQPNARSPRKEA